MDHSVSLRDPDKRIRYTLDSIREWLKKSENIKIVICDGSGFDFDPLIKKIFPKASIECLFFLNEVDKIKKFGKGYGEGEIISYALKHSKFIIESQWFAKCTAKLWVKNFDEIIKNWNNLFYADHIFLMFILSRLLN